MLKPEGRPSSQRHRRFNYCFYAPTRKRHFFLSSFLSLLHTSSYWASSDGAPPKNRTRAPLRLASSLCSSSSGVSTFSCVHSHEKRDCQSLGFNLGMFVCSIPL